MEELLKQDWFLVIDKPRNMLSHEISSYVRKILGVEKTGHAGTLDPKVSGVLVVGINRATKLLRFLTSQPKVYVGVVEFKKKMNREEVENIFKKFRGEITQIPPKESAVARRKRKRKVFSLEVIEIKGKKVLFKASVEAGTYIRTLCKDMGGKMVDLRRIKSTFYEREAYSMDELVVAKKAYDNGWESLLRSMLISVEETFFRLPFPKIMVSKKTAEKLIDGSPLFFEGLVAYESFKEGDTVSVFSNSKLVGIGRVEKEKIKMLRVHLLKKDLSFL